MRIQYLTIYLHKINELARLKGKGATLRAVVKDLYGNEYTSNEMEVDNFFS